jgi:HD-GYP domain-containing protein (c-di-GMP phosphodiesterase class II)
LSVSRGSLTREEFAEIQSHVVHTYEFLRKIPWGRSYPNVPLIAGKHHEKLDGTGYPKGSFEEEIPTQTRLMTIADIFDALTASDRPYKKAVPVVKALEILEMEVKVQKIDKDLFDIFVESKVYNSVLDKSDGWVAENI